MPNPEPMRNENGITIAQLKEFLEGLSLVDEDGEDLELWIETGDGLLLSVVELWPINSRADGCDVLLKGKSKNTAGDPISEYLAPTENGNFDGNVFKVADRDDPYDNYAGFAWCDNGIDIDVVRWKGFDGYAINVHLPQANIPELVEWFEQPKGEDSEIEVMLGGTRLKMKRRADGEVFYVGLKRLMHGFCQESWLYDSRLENLLPWIKRRLVSPPDFLASSSEHRPSDTAKADRQHPEEGDRGKIGGSD